MEVGARVVAVNHQHLRAFYAIANDASVSRAARRLNVAQPTLSQQLKALEDRHHVVLFENRKPPLSLTPAGKELFALAQRLFAVSGVIDEYLQENPDDRPAAVRLGSDSPVYAARLAGRMKTRFPDLTIQVRIGNARETLKALVDAQVDVAIVSDPPGDNNLTYEPLFIDRMMVAMPAGHCEAKSPFFPLEVLAKSRLLVREPNSRTRMAMEHLLNLADVVPAEMMELHTRDTIREGVALGLGVGMFISSECPPDDRISYAPVEPIPGDPGMAGFVVCLTNRRRTPLMRAVMDMASDLRTLSPLPMGSSRVAATPPFTVPLLAGSSAA